MFFSARKLRAKLQYFSDICKENRRFSIWTADFCVPLFSRSSPAHRLMATNQGEAPMGCLSLLYTYVCAELPSSTLVGSGLLRLAKHVLRKVAALYGFPSAWLLPCPKSDHTTDR
jgi:hypothetical protein